MTSKPRRRATFRNGTALLAALVGLPLLAAPPTPAVAAEANAIVRENQLPGSPASEWEVSGYGDPSIQGFATDISVNVGGTVDLKIDTTSTDYRVDIYRLGWYGGDGARKVATIATGATAEADQPACALGPAPENLLDCGNWAVSASWAVPADAVSGIYIARPVRQDAGGRGLASHIPFIVRDDASRAGVFFQASVTTWQSYNAYGGYNLYGYTGTTHAHKVSFNRPFQTRGTEPENYLFNAEYPMLRWLERNGYDMSYTTSVDTARRGQLIRNHDVFLSVGHDEYWSQEQRDAVEAARDAVDPTNIAFLSANEIYWKIRWEDNFRTQVTYKEGNSAPTGATEHYRCWDNFECDPSPIWTGQWRQAPGSTPENSVSGQISWRDDVVAMTVPAQFAPLRFWRDTEVAALQPGGQVTLAEGTVGYEWDPEQPEFAAYYPQGRILLSSTTINGEQHNMSLYRAPSGALVFGAGTVQWPWGLDASPSTPQATENRNMQQATANLLADMGALPTSLQNGLTQPTASTDTIAPSVTITAPVEGAQLPGGSVVLSGTASDPGGAVAAVEVSVDDGATWARATGTSQWQYTLTRAQAGPVTALVRATDDSANRGAPARRSFTTGAQVCDQANPCSLFAPSVTGAEESDSGAVELGVKFRAETDGWITGIRFYKTTGNTGTHTGRLWTTTGVNLATVVFTGETASGWQQATFDAPIPITANTTYIASYHAPVGRYALGTPFTAAVDTPPLHGLADGTDGPNGVYRYGPGGTVPTSTYQGSNYLVDVLFATTATPGPDVTPPSVVSRAPAVGATRVPQGANVTAAFSEALDAATVTTASVLLRDPAGAVVPAAVTWEATARTATLDPAALLAFGTTYTATIRGGAGGVKDLAGNAMAADVSWSFTTAQQSVARPDPNAGPGGPVLVVKGTGSHGGYLTEILRAEGLNLFTVGSLADLTPAALARYETLVLGETTLTQAQVTALTDWVGAGGNLVALRPPAALAGLLGLSPASGTVTEGYLAVDTATSPGAGITATTMQFHGVADRYTVQPGTRAVATLYTTATTATANPAVTLRSVGTAGGSAAAFTFDLASSVVLTRQGNPAWVNQNRDNEAGPNRANDLFFGDAPLDSQPDWVDHSRVAIPQADEQQRLLANLITEMTLDAMPLPRLWYLPRGESAALVLTSDNHDGGSVPDRFATEVAASPAGCSVGDWDCVRSTAYLYPTNTQMTDAQANAFEEQGFEIALHPNTSCFSPTKEQFAGLLEEQLAALAATYPSLDAARTGRNHCIAWIDWTDVPQVLADAGTNLDTNYYYWPPTWVANTPGLFTGSGFPQRFADATGQLVDVYQATTQMTDESGQAYPYTAEALMDRALGAEGYYGTFVANLHTDGLDSSEQATAAVIAAAQARGVPIISAQQLLEWTDGRTNSSFGNIRFADGILSFSISAAAGANGLQAMVPVVGPQGQLQQLTVNGAPVPTLERTIKGVRYAFFTAGVGTYAASYGADTFAPVISAVSAAPHPDGTATISWTTDEPATSRVDHGTAPAALTATAQDGVAVTAHQLTLTGLTPGTQYFYRVSSTDGVGNTATSPDPLTAPLTFQMPGISSSDDTVAHFSAGTPDAMAVTDIAGGEVLLTPAVGAEFDGTALPGGWNSTAWGSGGGTTVSGGAATVDGALLTTGQLFDPGRSLEFVATLGAASNVHAGLGVDVNNVARWALFSTFNSGGGTLYARTNADGTVANVPLPGALVGTPHRYRIDWLPDRVVFSVDGAVVHTQTVAITGQMRPVISDYSAGGAAVALDWARLSPYAPAGSFLSRIHDAGTRSDWGPLAYTADLPSGTALAVAVRAGETPTPDPTWTVFTPVAQGADIPVTGRYLQYRVQASTSDPAVTPVLRAVDLPHVPAPSGDTVAPTVTGRAPAPDATGVAVDANVVVTFSEPVTVPDGAVRLRAAGASADVPAAVTVDGSTVTLDPGADLVRGTSYGVVLTSQVADGAGNALAPETWTFTTLAPDTVAPTVVGRAPAADATGVAVGGDVVVTFSEPVTVPDGAVRLRAAGASVDVPAAVTAAATTVTLNPDGDLLYATAYTVTVTGTITDPAGNPVAAESWTFTTAPPPDTVAPTVTGRLPVPDATDVPVGSDVVITVSEPVTVPAGAVRLRAGGATADVPATLAVQGTTVTLNPEADLEHSTRYTVTVGATITDVAGNALAAEAWTFTTAPPPDTVAPTVVGRLPAPDALDVAVEGDVVVTFSEPVTVPAGAVRLRAAGATADLAATLTVDGTVATLNPDADLANATGYTVTLTAAITDAAGNALAPETWSYTTVPPLDPVAPTVTGRSPAPDARDVPVGSDVVITVSEPVTVPAGAVRLRAVGGTADVAATVTVDGTTVTLNPDADLAHATGFTVTLTEQVKDLAGNALAPESWTFTTAPPPDTTPPAVTGRLPAPGATNVAVGSDVVITVSEPVTVPAGAVQLRAVGANTDVAATLSVNGTTVTLNPNADLANATGYTVTLTNQIKDAAGNALAPETWTFTTARLVCAAGVFRAEYFSNVNLSGTPILVRCEPAVNYTWGTGGPGAPVPVNNFSARWTTTTAFTARTWTFTTVTDEGVRLKVDGNTVINNWRAHTTATNTARVPLTAGNHTVVMEYYERTGNATARLSWQ